MQDQEHKDLIRAYLGERPSWFLPWKRIDYMVTWWILSKLAEGHLMSPSHIFLRCHGCFKLRSNRGMQMHKGPCNPSAAECRLAHGQCKCGGRRSGGNVGTVSTWQAFRVLVTGY